MDPMHKHTRARCLRAAMVAAIALPVAAAAVPAQTVATGRYAPVLDPKDFTSTISNPWFPLTPGTVFRYQGTGSSSNETTVTEVTSGIRSVAGIPARIVHDRVFRSGELVEDTYDWYSQDRAGNVWYLGEDTKALSKGRLTNTSGSWTAGVDGAQPGIVMWGDPAAHLNSRYHQEYLAGTAEDMGMVTSTNKSVSVPAGRYRSCVETLDTTPLDPRVHEHKYYCRGVGLVKEAESAATGSVLTAVTHTVAKPAR